MRYPLTIFLTMGLMLLSQKAYAELNDATLLPKAQNGDACAQAQIGYNYNHGQGGVRVNYSQAIEWYTKAATADCKDDQCKQCQKSSYKSLGYIYRGFLNPPDKAKAFYWIQKSAENGNILNYKDMAEYYAAGEFVPQDYSKAYYWIRRGLSKNTKTQYDDFIVKIKSKLSSSQIEEIEKKIDSEQQAMVQKQQANFAKTLDKSTLGFNPSIPSEDRANARLAFEINLNNFGRDLVGIKKLIDMGALKKNPVLGEPFLFTAIENNDLELVQLLLDNGINPNEKNSKGYTPLMSAVTPEKIEIAEALIKSGADINATNNTGETALINAANSGNLRLVNDLIEAGANVHIESRNDGYGGPQDALFKARRNGYQKISEALINAGAIKKENSDYISFDKVPTRCPRDQKKCPNGNILTLFAPACEYAACPDPQLKPAVSSVKGTYSEIDTALSDQAIHALNDGTDQEKDAIIDNIRLHSSKYNPQALMALSRVLFSRIEDDEAAFWFMASFMRNREDSLICAKPNSPFNDMGFIPQMNPYLKLHPKAVKVLIEKVVEWDKTTPAEYDLRWAFKNKTYKDNYNLTDPVPQNLCVSDDRQASLRETARNLYVREMEKFTQKSYSMSPIVSMPTKEAYAELLKKAEAGDAKSQFEITTPLYSSVIPSSTMKEKGEFHEKWLTLSANQGYLPAMAKLGQEYLLGMDYFYRGHGGQPDVEKGMKMLHAAGSKGEYLAYCYMGGYYRQMKQPIESYAWYSVCEAASAAKNVFNKPYEKAIIESELKGKDWEKAKILAREYITKYATH